MTRSSRFSVKVMMGARRGARTLLLESGPLTKLRKPRLSPAPIGESDLSDLVDTSVEGCAG